MVRAREDLTRQPVWELTFRLENGQHLTCLAEAMTADQAYDLILAAWKPPSRILTFSASEKHYFQISVPSLRRP